MTTHHFDFGEVAQTPEQAGPMLGIFGRCQPWSSLLDPFTTMIKALCNYPIHNLVPQRSEQAAIRTTAPLANPVSGDKNELQASRNQSNRKIHQYRFHNCMKRFIGARDGNRTRTAISREILSLLCLPISPPGRFANYIGPRMQKRESENRFPSFHLERQKSLELSTYTLARYRSTN